MIGRRAVAAATLVAAAALGVAQPAEADSQPQLLASGSTWAATLLGQAGADLQATGPHVNYVADGSAAGRRDFANRTTDFAVSDLPYQGTDPSTGAVDSPKGRSFAEAPIAAGGLAFPYHLTVAGQPVVGLRLSGTTLAGIFTGAITFWDAPAIEADNRGRLALPHEAITPVVHSEGSATSLRLASYLATEYPSAWGANGAPSPYYPAVPGAVGQNGSDGVVNYVGSAAGEGSIGYDEYTYALEGNLPVAAVENRAGYFVLPTGGNVSVALRSAPAEAFDTGAFRAVYDSTDPRAYPLSSWAAAFVPTAADDATMTTAKRQTLARFLAVLVCNEQNPARVLGEGPLPLNLVRAGFAAVQALHDADPNVDLTGLDLAHCTGNPALTPGDPPTDSDSDAPAPPACAAASRGPCGVPADVTTLTSSGPLEVRGDTSTLFASRATDTVTHHVLAGVPVSVWQLRAGSSTWTRVATASTAWNGTAVVRVRPGVTSRFQFRYAGDDEHDPALSAPTTISVRPVLTLLSVAHAAPGQAVAIWGFASPASSRRIDTVQVFTRSGWATLGHVMEGNRGDPDGRTRVSFVLVHRFPRGRYHVRVVSPASAAALASTSAQVSLLVQ